MSSSRMPPTPPPKPLHLQTRIARGPAPLPPEVVQISSSVSPPSFPPPPLPSSILEPARVSLGSEQEKPSDLSQQIIDSDLELDGDMLKEPTISRQMLVTDLDRVLDDDDDNALYLNTEELPDEKKQATVKEDEHRQQQQQQSEHPVEHILDNGKGEDQVDNVIADQTSNKEEIKTLDCEKITRSPSPAFFIEDSKLIEHLRMRNPDRLPKLIKMHLSILLDLNGDGFANIFQESLPPPVEEGKRFGTIKKRKHDTKVKEDKPIFQQILTEEGICRMYILIDFIGNESNINQEGIFRKCGSTARQQELKYRLQNQLDVDLRSGLYTVHDCSNVLKTCLSELPEPLLSDYFFKIICQCGQLALINQQSKRLKIVQMTLFLLPVKKRKFARDLLLLLQRVSSSENSDNKMNARNLATLFAPHLLCPKTITATEMQKWVSAMTDQLEFMIQHAHEIFELPTELLLDVRRELNQLNRKQSVNEENAGSVVDEANDEDCVNTVYTFCDRNVALAENHTSTTQQHVAELYAYIQSMPETPDKKKYIKQFNRKNGGLTPQLDKENSKRKGTSSKIGIRSIGDKLKHAKNLFKVTTTKNLLSAAKKSSSVHSVLDDEPTYQSGRKGRCHSSDDLLDSRSYDVFDDGKPKSSASVDDLLGNEEAPVDVPLSETTTTQFFFDDEEEHLRQLNNNKKKRIQTDTEDILADIPYASESIIV